MSAKVRISGLLYTLVVLVFFALFAFRGFPHFADDPGVGWHLTSGAWILAKHTVMTMDPFLSEARPWISDQWLSDVFFAGLLHIGGWHLLYLTALILFLIPGLFILPKILEVIDQPVSQIAFLLSLPIMLTAMSVHLIVRPVLFSFVFFSLQLLIIVGVYKGTVTEKSSLKKIYSILTIFVMYVMWTNMHPSFVLGIAILGLAAIAVVIDRFFLGATVPDASVTKHLLLLAITATVASMINPYGWRLHQSILALGHSDFFMTLNNEWLPLNLREDNGSLYLLSLGLLFFPMYLRSQLGKEVAVRYEKDSTDTFFFCGTLLFGFAALTSVRFLPYAAMFTFFSVLKNLSWFFHYYVKAPLRWVPQYSSAVFVGVVAVFFLAQATIGYPINPAQPLGPHREAYPYALLEQLQRTVPDSNMNESGDRVAIYNHPDIGGFITLMDQDKKFAAVLDDRNYLLGEDLYHEFLDAKTESQLASAAKNHHAQFIIQSIKRLPLEMHEQQLHELGRDSKYVLLELRTEDLRSSTGPRDGSE